MEKRAVIAFALVALTAHSFAATNQISDVLYVLEMVDSAGQKTFQAVPLDQYHSLRTEANLRNRFQPKALDQAKEEWKETYKGISKAFPANVASPESVTSLGLFTSEDAARIKLTELRARAEQRRAADDDSGALAKQIKAIKDDIAQLKAAPPHSIADRETKIQADRLALKLLEREYAEQVEKKVSREVELREARSIYDKKLAALMPTPANPDH